jgi:hypothetical protein
MLFKHFLTKIEDGSVRAEVHTTIIRFGITPHMEFVVVAVTVAGFTTTM